MLKTFEQNFDFLPFYGDGLYTKDRLKSVLFYYCIAMTHGPKIRCFVLQGRLVAPILAKFGMEEWTDIFCHIIVQNLESHIGLISVCNQCLNIVHISIRCSQHLTVSHIVMLLEFLVEGHSFLHDVLSVV